MRYVSLALLATAALLSGCQNTESEAPLPEACYQPPESGMCKAAFQRYYFDAQSGECQAFTWGGCKGSVPFETMESCVTTCNAKTGESATKMPMKGEPR